MTHDNDERLVAWLADGPAHGPTAALERAFSVTRRTRQRPAWLVAVRGGTIAAERTNSSVQLTWIVVAVVALTGLLIGTLVVGGWLRPLPAPTVELPSPTAPPSTVPVPDSGGLIAYTKITALEPDECPVSWVSLLCFPPRLWISNADGSAARELLPDTPGRQEAVGWSPDGTRLLFVENNGGRLMLTDESGSDPEPLDAVCPETCTGFGSVVFSPDGSRIAFVRSDTSDTSVIATMDLADGRVTELESTRLTGFAMGSNGDPSWSPDGTQLVFSRQGTPVEGGGFQDILLLVNADGSNLHQISPPELGAGDPHWSPDGSQIVFVSSWRDPAATDPIVFISDIYAIRPDGTGLLRLTTDGESVQPNWTAGGRITYTRFAQDPATQDVAPTYELWIMDADGGGKTRLQADSASELSDAGCNTCPYPPPLDVEIFILNDAYWQPTP